MTFMVVDASVWVARLVPQDIFFPAVKAWFEEVRRQDIQLLSPALLLAEVGGAISRRTGEASLARQAVEALQNLPGLRLVEMDRALVQAASMLAADHGLRGADACYAALASRLKIQLITLDKDQHDRANGVVAVQMIGNPG
jgi:predicted nucleic acid-binding protein